ncbi:hypothetical protein IWQ61_003507 [Dispira simplex]|nr:hypothetical protein IWQ61_003507 [Dispira simplex]
MPKSRKSGSLSFENEHRTGRPSRETNERPVKEVEYVTLGEFVLEGDDYTPVINTCIRNGLYHSSRPSCRLTQSLTSEVRNDRKNFCLDFLDRFQEPTNSLVYNIVTHKKFY